MGHCGKGKDDGSTQVSQSDCTADYIPRKGPLGILSNVLIR